jgi:hypothetical protein
VGKLAAGWEEAGDGDPGAEPMFRARETRNLSGGQPVLEEYWALGTTIGRADAR